MNLKIIQPAGIGDILFCQKILWNMAHKYEFVYWPISEACESVKKYLCIPKNARWNCDGGNMNLLDLQNASKKHPDKSFMTAKYSEAGIEMDGWQNHVAIKRNPERENELFEKLCPKGDYCLVSNSFGTPPNTFTAPVKESKELPNVWIRKMEEDTVFDWIKIIEHAKEIRIVDTCFTFLVEKFASTDRLFLYPRKPFYSTGVTKELWKKAWVFVDG